MGMAGGESTRNLETLQSAECLLLLIEAAKEYAVFLLDPQGRIASWNTGAQGLKGYAAAEILGQLISVFYTPDDRAGGKPERELKVAAAEGRLAEEGWRIRKDGSRFWASIAITALRGPNHEIVGFAKVTRDLSEQRATNMRFRLLEFGPDGALVVDPQGVIVYANPRTKQLFGYDEAELLGRQIGALVPERFRPDHHSHRTRFHETPSARSMGTSSSSVYGLRKDGTEFPAEISLSPMEDASGLVISFIRDTGDVRRLALERARAADRVAHLNSLGVLLSGAVDVGEVTAVILSSGLKEIGAFSSLLVHVVENGRELVVLGEAGGASGHVEEVGGGRQRSAAYLQFPHGDVVLTGSALWLHDPAEIAARFPALAISFAESGCRSLACLPMISRGVITGALRLAFTDERAFDTNERLFVTSFVRQCALALDRAHLYEDALEARRAAERVSLMRDEFLSIVAHDLGNPLNTVGLWAHSIRNAALSGSDRKMVVDGTKRINAAVDRMALLLQDLGDVSSIDAGHLGIKRQDRNLETIVADTIEASLHSASPRISRSQGRLPRCSARVIRAASSRSSGTSSATRSSSPRRADESRSRPVLREGRSSSRWRTLAPGSTNRLARMCSIATGAERNAT